MLVNLVGFHSGKKKLCTVDLIDGVSCPDNAKIYNKCMRIANEHDR